LNTRANVECRCEAEMRPAWSDGQVAPNAFWSSCDARRRKPDRHFGSVHHVERIDHVVEPKHSITVRRALTVLKGCWSHASSARRRSNPLAGSFPAELAGSSTSGSGRSGDRRRTRPAHHGPARSARPLTSSDRHQSGTGPGTTLRPGAPHGLSMLPMAARGRFPAARTMRVGICAVRSQRTRDGRQ
jgi:hypothetical protein